MATKRELYSPGDHPNVGMTVTMVLVNKNSNVESKKEVKWNGTHWVLAKKSGETAPIPGNFELRGWYE